MTQPYQYDPSQQPGQPGSPYDPSQQPGQPASPFDAAPQPGQSGAPFDPAQQPPSLDPAGNQPPPYQPGQVTAQPFGPSNEPPMFPPPSGNFLPPEPKKSKGGMFIVLGIVVLLLIGGGIGVAIWRPWAPDDSAKEKAESSKEAEDEGEDKGKDSDDGEKEEDSDEGVPSQVVDDAWHAKDWDEAKGYMCESLVTELEDAGAAENYQPIGADEEFKTTGEKIEDDKATVSVETTVKSSSGQPEIGKLEVSLVKEESDWKICEINDVA